MVVRFLLQSAGILVAILCTAGLLARHISPDIWWPPATIALGLPLLLLLNTLFIILCLHQKWYQTMVYPVLVLVAALPLTPRLFALGSSTGGETNKAAIKLLTMNVRGFRDAAHRNLEKTEALAIFEKVEPPDILLLQEARHARERNPLFVEIKRLNGLGKRHQPKRKTLATYADDPTFIADEFDSPGGFNGFLVTDITTKIGPIRVVNAHLASNRITGMAHQIGSDKDFKKEVRRAESMLRKYGAGAAVRAKQAESIRRYIDESPHPVIVAGDFNDVPSSYTYQRLLSPRLRDAWTEAGTGIGTTFTGPLPALRIDFVLVDTSLQVRSIERVQNEFSDHLGLAVEVE